MPTVQALQGFRHHGRPVAPGRVIEVSDAESVQLMNANRVMVVPAPGNCTRDTRRCVTALNPQEDTPACCRSHVVELVRYVSGLLNEVGVTWWADYGTLLGAVRHGGLIPWDADADLCVLDEDGGKEAMLLLAGRAKAAGYHFVYIPSTRRLYGGGDRVKIYLSDRNQTPVDLFFWHRIPGGFDRREYVACDQFKGRAIPEAHLLPLGTVAWEGMTLPAPAHPERLLDHRYGTGWRKPYRGQPTHTPRLDPYLHGRSGLGDSIYLRPLVRAAAAAGPVWVETPWPELFEDLPVLFAKPRTDLRTQRKNMSAQPADRYRTPVGVTKYQLTYDWQNLEKGALFATMEAQAPVCADPFVFDLPDFGPCPVKTRKPIALIRPVTERREWLNRARNPLPEYVAEAARILRAEGYHVVSVADLKPGEEWMLDPAPEADVAYHAGELGIRDLMALVQHAAVVVGGSGWIIPASIAAGVPLVVIGGGQAGHNGPDKVTDPRMDLSRTTWVEPDHFCACADMLHDCDKTITDFGAKFTAARARVAPPRRRRAVA
jgi:hypothetical protein